MALMQAVQDQYDKFAGFVEAATENELEHELNYWKEQGLRPLGKTFLSWGQDDTAHTMLALRQRLRRQRKA